MENQATSRPMLLVLEPDPLMLTGISAVLDSQGYRCFLARDVDVAIQATRNVAFDLFVVSFGTEVTEACKWANQLRKDNATHDVPVIFLADQIENQWRALLNSSGGAFCLPKPFEPELLIDAVDRALWMPQLAQTRIQPPRAHFAKDWIKIN